MLQIIVSVQLCPLKKDNPIFVASKEAIKDIHKYNSIRWWQFGGICFNSKNKYHITKRKISLHATRFTKAIKLGQIRQVYKSTIYRLVRQIYEAFSFKAYCNNTFIYIVEIVIFPFKSVIPFLLIFFNGSIGRCSILWSEV